MYFKCDELKESVKDISVCCTLNMYWTTNIAKKMRETTFSLILVFVLKFYHTNSIHSFSGF